MSNLAVEQFKGQLAMLLRDLPRATTAELTDFAVAWWDGHQVVYAFLRDDGSGAIDEEFDLDDYQWQEWETDLARWVAQPKFGERAEVREWLNESPPYDMT